MAAMGISVRKGLYVPLLQGWSGNGQRPSSVNDVLGLTLMIRRIVVGAVVLTGTVESSRWRAEFHD